MQMHFKYCFAATSSTSTPFSTFPPKNFKRKKENPTTKPQALAPPQNFRLGGWFCSWLLMALLLAKQDMQPHRHTPKDTHTQVEHTTLASRPGCWERGEKKQQLFPSVIFRFKKGKLLVGFNLDQLWRKKLTEVSENNLLSK